MANDSNRSLDELTTMMQRMRERHPGAEGNAEQSAPTEKLIHELQVHQLELEVQNRELRDAQASLEESRARYAELYDFAPVAYLTLDSDGQIVELNLSACTLLGRERERLIGRSFVAVAAIWEPAVFWAHLKNCIHSGQRTVSELRLGIRGGPPITVEMVTMPAMISAARRLIFRTALTDVTLRKRAEAALQFLVDTGIPLSETLDVQRSLDLVAQLAVRQFGSICIAQITEEGESVNLTGAAAVEHYPDRILAEIKQGFTLLPGVAEKVSQVVRTGESLLLDTLQTMNPLGSQLTRALWIQQLGIESLAVLSLHARGRNFGVLLLGRHAKEPPLTPTELRLAEVFVRRAALAIDNAHLFEQTRRATQARDEAMALISHDLRGGIASIAWNAQLLLSMVPIGEQPGRRQLELIERAAVWMKRLIGDLLNSSQIESGTLEVASEPLSVYQVAKEAIALMSSEAAESSIRLETDVPEGLFIQGDSERVNQILINLLSNGIKFSPSGGRVLVRARPFNGEVQFEIVDQGRGIAEADLPHIFERYWRRHSKGGVGLGLFIARGIVEAHGGSMRVESCPGEGATFIFTLPLADVSGRSASEAPPL